MTSKSAPLAVYVFLIVLFYNKTDGFQKTAGVFNYCFFKSIPVFALSALVYFEQGGLKGVNRTSHALGLFFGACGDFIISFHQHGLVTGAVAFALGHLAYMGTFALQLHKVSGELATVCLLYALFVNHYFLMPQFWFHPISTLILMGYSLILGTALVISGSLYFRGTKAQTPRQMNNLLRFLGYALFFLSDSMLLLDHAGQPLPYPAVLILCTYYASQYFILMGSVHSEEVLEAPIYKNRVLAKASM
ncbi:yhhN family domain-containing protein [Ditylenchus destructor]|nr:yhhN family domain-containing protein [Ditylenchus destructor]